MHIAVVGAGITGLSAAHGLAEQARRRGLPLRLQVLEAADRPGGHARTVREDGFLVEAGPNGFLDREPAPLELVRELGLGSQLIEARPEARRRFVVREGRLRAMPGSPLGLLLSDALSLRGKLRLLLEPWAPRARGGWEDSVEEFARRRIGAEAAAALVDSAVAGISAGDSRALSARAAFPLVVEMERRHGSLFRAMIARRGTRTRLVGLESGMGALIEALAARLGDALCTRARVTGLRRAGGEWRLAVAKGAEVSADRVILALPAHAAAQVVRGLDAEMGDALDQIPFCGVSVVALAYRASEFAHPLDGYGYLFQRDERFRTLGVVWESSVFAGRAPDGAVLLRAFVGGARDPAAAELSEAEVTRVARQELARVLGVSVEPIACWVFRWPRAIAQYTVGHLERVGCVHRLAARHPGLDLIGTSYDGISFGGAIAAGRGFAERLAAESWPPDGASSPPPPIAPDREPQEAQ